MALNAHTLAKTILGMLNYGQILEMSSVMQLRIYTSTSCARLGLIQLNVLHRMVSSKKEMKMKEDHGLNWDPV